MRTTVILDEKLVKEALQFAPHSSKSDLVNLALQEFVQNHRPHDIRKLRGKIKFLKGYKP